MSVLLLASPAAATPTPTATSAVTASPSVVFSLSDPRLDEISGLAPGLASPSVVYAENDSGDSARFFALDARTGAVRGVYSVSGAHNVDWEDLAVAPDSAGHDSVWLADIGDNDAERADVTVYRVDEPRLSAGQDVGDVATSAPDVWTLRYPDGAVNAESFMVAPGGIGYLVTKSVLGASTVYRLPVRPGAGELTEVARVQFAPAGSADPFGVVGELTATGASISPDGSLLAIRTYSDAYLWHLSDGDVAAALRAEPTRVTLPDQPQGESIALTSSAMLIASEGVGSAVYSVPLPQLPAARTPASTSAGVRSSAAAAPSPTPTDRTPTPGRTVGTLVVIVLLLALVALGWFLRNRRRPRRSYEPDSDSSPPRKGPNR